MLRPHKWGQSWGAKAPFTSNDPNSDSLRWHLNRTCVPLEVGEAKFVNYQLRLNYPLLNCFDHVALFKLTDGQRFTDSSVEAEKIDNFDGSLESPLSLAQ